MDNIIYTIRYNIDLHFNYLCSGCCSLDELSGYISCACCSGAISKDERSFIFKAALYV